MTPAHLERIGILMYGNRWKATLAADLSVTRQTIHEWMKTSSPPWADGKIADFITINIILLKKARREMRLPRKKAA